MPSSVPPTPVGADPSDELLLARFVREDDMAALETLATRHEAILLGAATGLLGGRDASAADAVQNVWIKVIRYGRSYRGGSSVRTWLYRILINECRRLQRREVAAAVRLDSTLESSSLHLAALNPSTSGEGVEPSLLARAAAAVASLPEAQRELVLLCYHADLSHRQVAEILMLPIGTVKSRLHAALERLRHALTPEPAG